jgi:hypothetical protein
MVKEDTNPDNTKTDVFKEAVKMGRVKILMPKACVVLRTIVRIICRNFRPLKVSAIKLGRQMPGFFKTSLPRVL